MLSINSANEKHMCKIMKCTTKYNNRISSMLHFDLQWIYHCLHLNPSNVVVYVMLLWDLNKPLIYSLTSATQWLAHIQFNNLDVCRLLISPPSETLDTTVLLFLSYDSLINPFGECWQFSDCSSLPFINPGFFLSFIVYPLLVRLTQ